MDLTIVQLTEHTVPNYLETVQSRDQINAICLYGIIFLEGFSDLIISLKVDFCSAFNRCERVSLLNAN